jgi:hypothetical protein
MKTIDKNNKNEVVAQKNEAGNHPALVYCETLPPPTKKEWSLDDAQEHRKDRYTVLSKARNLLMTEGKKHFPLMPTKYHRTTLCKHAMTGSELAVVLSSELNKAFYDGLQTCGNVWVCPVCAAKIQERRRLEIASAMEHFYQVKKMAVMVTFTFPHKMMMKLKDLLTKQSEAFKLLRKGKQWDKFKAKHCFEGLIRSLEVTHGQNGWHPHTHELWFVECEIDEAKFFEFVKKKWRASCIASGLLDENDPKQMSAFDTYAVDIKFNCKASDYLAKVDHKDNLKSYWGADREIAKASSKVKKEGKGMHPFQLAIDNKQDLFIEYVNAIKGKPQLLWSRGLKAKVGITEKTDEEIAEEETEEAELFAKISKVEWLAIRRQEQRAQVLNCVENSKSVYELRSFILKIIEDDFKNE